MIRHFAVQRFCPSSPLQCTPTVTQTQRVKIEIFLTQTFKTNWKSKGGGGGWRKLGYLCKSEAPRPLSSANSGDLPLSLSHSITRTREQHLCVTTNTLSSTALSDQLSLCFKKKKSPLFFDLWLKIRGKNTSCRSLKHSYEQACKYSPILSARFSPAFILNTCIPLYILAKLCNLGLI